MGSVNPEELPLAVAEMLNARVVTDHLRLTHRCSDLEVDDGTTLRIPSPRTGLFVFFRPDEPFTPAESARANRLAQIAEAALITQARPVIPSPRDVTWPSLDGHRTS